jgi:hypothetical protein
MQKRLYKKTFVFVTVAGVICNDFAVENVVAIGIAGNISRLYQKVCTIAFVRCTFQSCYLVEELGIGGDLDVAIGTCRI